MEIEMSWKPMRREPKFGAVPYSIRPARPWDVDREIGGEIEWLRDARGRIRMFSDEKSALAAVPGLDSN
jgi:hypothetical protein